MRTRISSRMRSFRRSHARFGLTTLLVIGGSSCADVNLGPSVPATIEFSGLAAPAVVLGDTLRDIDGVAAPAHAVVRNQAGDIIADANVHYVYADAARDTAFLVDSLTGYIVSLQPLKGSATTARIAASVGDNLQIVRSVRVTTRPDAIDLGGAASPDTLHVALPDTGALITKNVSVPLAVTVRHFETTGSDTVRSTVANWLVKYELLQPANPENDSTQSVFLVNELRRVSNIDTTDISGVASRSVRVRAAQFPADTMSDSAVVRVTVKYRGVDVKGSPVRIVLPIIRKP